MTWYYILFFIVFVFFIIKTCVSYCLDDMKFYSSDDIKFDISSILTFNGFMQFLLGFSGYLCLVAKFGKNHIYQYDAETFDYILTYNFTTLNYIIAVIVGILFIYLLKLLYKLLLIFNCFSKKEFDFTNCTCKIIENLGNGNYKVSIKTHIGTIERNIKSYNSYDRLEVGNEFKIIKMFGEYFI